MIIIKKIFEFRFLFIFISLIISSTLYLYTFVTPNISKFDNQYGFLSFILTIFFIESMLAGLFASITVSENGFHYKHLILIPTTFVSLTIYPISLLIPFLIIDLNFVTYIQYSYPYIYFLLIFSICKFICCCCIIIAIGLSKINMGMAKKN